MTGTIATAAGGPGVTGGADGEAVGVAGVAEPDGLGLVAGVALATVLPVGVADGPPAAAPLDGDALALPKPSSPPVMGSAMAIARRPKTSRSGPRFTARMLPADRRTPRPGGRTGRREMR